MRMINTNNLGVGKCDPKVFNDKGFAAGWNSAIQAIIETSPAVDPETLPIVQELREQLAKVTAEKDALLKEVAGECGLCLHYDTCKNSDKNTCFLGSEWELRGIE